MKSATNEARVRVGVAGWYYPDWQGIVYPTGRRGVDHLRYLAQFVDVIEINNTFYRPPETGDVANWCERVADIKDFVFTLKLYQRFTHMGEEGLGTGDSPDSASRSARRSWDSPRRAELQDFLRRIRPIFERGLGGALLAQFPHSFHRTSENEAYLRELLRQIEGIPVVVEVRHYTWNSAEALATLRELGAAICSIDQPMFRGSLKPLEQVTSGIAYIRLHGRTKKNWFSEKADRDERYDYLYSDAELGPWVERARRLAEKAREVYVIANNHFHGQAACNAIMFKSLILGRRVPAPAQLIKNFPELKAHANPDAPLQEELF